MGVLGESWPRGDPDLEGLMQGRFPMCNFAVIHVHTHTRTPNSHPRHPSANPRQHQSTDHAPKALVFLPNTLRAQNKTEKRRDPGSEANK